MDAPFAAAIRERFGELSFLGEDGSGPVWGGLDRRSKQLVRVRALTGRSPEEVARIVREAGVLTHLTHLGLERVLEAGPGDERHAPYLMVEHLEGETLADRMAGHVRTSLEEALVIGEQLAAALAALHGVGVAHRGFRAAWAVYLGHGAVKVGGAGLAEGPADTPGDQYALGLVVYELIAGKTAQVPPLPLAEAFPGVPRDVDAAVMRALAADPAERFAQMADFAQALREAHARLTGAPLFALPPGGVMGPGPVRTRRRRGGSFSGRGFSLPVLPVDPFYLACGLGVVVLISIYSIVSNLAGEVLGNLRPDNAPPKRAQPVAEAGGSATTLGGAIVGGSSARGSSVEGAAPRRAATDDRAIALGLVLVGKQPADECGVPGPGDTDGDIRAFLHCRLRRWVARIAGS